LTKPNAAEKDRQIMKKKKTKRIIIGILLGLFAVCTILFVIYKSALDPYRGTAASLESLPLDAQITPECAIKDMDYVMQMLRERHPAWLEEDNQRVRDTEACYEEEVHRIRESGEYLITVLEEWKAISRIMHCLYDGHSGVYPTYSNMLYIDDFTQLRSGNRIVMIDGISYEELLKRFLDVYYYETESYAQAVFDSNVTCCEAYLNWIDIDTSDGVDITFDERGTEETYHYGFVPIEEVKGYDEDTEDEQPWVYYEIDNDAGVGIFTLTSCIYNDEYKRTVKEFFDAVEDAGIRNVIVDLRWNGGGSSMVGDEFIHYLDVDGYYSWPAHVRFGNFLYKSDKSYIRNPRSGAGFDGNVYILTNRKTFSAAMDFTMLIMDNGLGTVVGEESGNLPDSYGDILLFNTPCSQLRFSVSYKRWFRLDETKSGQPLIPDYPCDSAEAMDKAYELILEK